MGNVFRTRFKQGIVTRAYPAQPEPAPPAFRGQVQIDANRCTGAGDCAIACPSGAIQVERSAPTAWTWRLNDATCVFCGLCVEACPTRALRFSNEFELAVRTAADLVTEVAFERNEP